MLIIGLIIVTLLIIKIGWLQIAQGFELQEMEYKQQTLNRAIMVANDTANQVKRTSRDEAESIVNEARRNASRIVNDALLRDVTITELITKISSLPVV